MPKKGKQQKKARKARGGAGGAGGAEAETSTFPTGFQNYGNTCYLNSVIQLLLLNPEFNPEGVRGKSDAIKRIKDELGLFSHIFNDSKQHDAGEALMAIMNIYYKKRQLKLFQYQLEEETTTICSSYCYRETISRKTSSLLLDVSGKTLQSCYQKSVETFSIEREQNCEECKSTTATKTVSFTKKPKWLIIGLKRFTQVKKGRKFISAKDDRDIEIPFEWDLDTCKYQLCGSILHLGDLEAGHYVCIGKKEELNKWFYFDDSVVSEITDETQLKNYLNKSYYFLYKAI